MQIRSVNFPAPVVVEYHKGLWWEVKEPFQVNVTIDFPLMLSIIVPVGFLTNLASVPRPLWPLFPPEGGYTEAAVIHDYLYERGGKVPGLAPFTKADSDRIFLLAMETLGVSWVVRNTMWLAVKAFGRGKF